MKSTGSKRSVLRSIGAATIAEMLLSLVTLPLGLGYITSEIGGEAEASDQCVLLFTVFFVMALTRMLRARRFRMAGKPGWMLLMQWGYCIAFMLCGILPLFIGYTMPVGIQDTKNLTGGYLGDVRQLIALIFWIVMLIGRIFSMVHNRRWRKTLLNVILSVIAVVMAAITFVGCDMTISMIAIVVMSLGSIFGVAFGRFRVDVLKTIIRKTYASEILLGLLLLIFAFAYVFKFIEPGIPTFPDGLWYCFAIVTTIGFGDISAVTLVGRILSVILGIYGIIVVAMITSIIVNFYGETRKDADETEGQATDE